MVLKLILPETIKLFYGGSSKPQANQSSDSAGIFLANSWLSYLSPSIFYIHLSMVHPIGWVRVLWISWTHTQRGVGHRAPQSGVYKKCGKTPRSLQHNAKSDSPLTNTWHCVKLFLLLPNISEKLGPICCFFQILSNNFAMTPSCLTQHWVRLRTEQHSAEL